MLKPYVTRTRIIYLFLISIIVLISGCSTPRELSYVALGDSIPVGYEVGDENYVEYFADYLRQDLGIDVEVHNYANSGDVTGRLLDLLQIDPEIRQAIVDANVITIWIGLNDLWPPLYRFEYGNCGGEDNLDCVREKVAQINENIDGILDEILVLNTSKKTRIMIADNGIPFVLVSKWKKHGWFDVLQEEAYEAWRDHLVEAASERGIIVVYTYRVINGPLGDQENEELYRYDGIHFTEEGHKLIADLHREAWE